MPPKKLLPKSLGGGYRHDRASSACRSVAGGIFHITHSPGGAALDRQRGYVVPLVVKLSPENHPDVSTWAAAAAAPAMAAAVLARVQPRRGIKRSLVAPSR